MEANTENYQLKWHSFGTYLHGCVAASLNADCFTDVSLVTMDGRQILAHRFILSACSQYLHQVLKLQTKTNTPLSIILPPEINYKTLKVLVQYMYSGETTVSQDILENVLRGGDLLKVKGLWRPKEADDAPERIEKPDRPDKAERRSNASANSNKFNQQSNSTRHSRSNTSTPASACSTTPIHNHSVIKEPHRSMYERTEPVVSKRQKNEESVIKTTQQTPPPLAPIQLRNKHPDRFEMRQERQEKLARARDIDKEKDTGTAKDLMQILVIKEEPIEWSEVNPDEIELVEREEIFDSELMIKPEIQMDDVEENPEELYTPLTCELCSETFTVPADWVKHDTHRAIGQMLH